MSSKYLAVPAEGQVDNTSCWAACLKWWLKAVRSIDKAQSSIIDDYNYLTDEYYAMGEDAMQWIILDNNMFCDTYDHAKSVTADVIKQNLANGPIYIAYRETKSRKNHVNVIYDIEGSGKHARVRVMEPQVSENPDMTYSGAHQLKSISEFNRIGKIMMGYNY